MKPRNWIGLIMLHSALMLAGYAESVVVISEDFDSLTLGAVTGIKSEITDGTVVTGLRLHNHLIGEVVTPDPSFTRASGQAFQLTTGTNPTGGWGQLSADNRPRAVSLIEGDEIILSFDLYVQAVPQSTVNLELKLAFAGGADTTRIFTELGTASAGDVISVAWTNTVTASMATATNISPQISFEGHQNNFSSEGPNGDGTELDVAQIDNLLLQVPYHPPTYYLDADGGADTNAGTSPAEAWATLARASEMTFERGTQLLLERGDTFVGKLTLADDSGTAALPVVVASYGTGDRPVINAVGYQAGVHIQNSDYIEVRDLEITGDGGTMVDGSGETKRYGVRLDNTAPETVSEITLENLYIHDIYPSEATESEGVNPTTYFGMGISIQGDSSLWASNIVVQACQIEEVGYKAFELTRVSNLSLLNNEMTHIGGPAIVPNRCDDLLVRGNVVDASGAYTDSRMHGRGSGIWPINCNRVLIEKNAFMHARGRYDSCGAHIDHDNTDVVIQYNLSRDNEGGFVEILGGNYNCTYRYNISINDGAREITGANTGEGYTIEVTGHYSTDRFGPFNSYIYNNTIYTKSEITSRFRNDETTDGLLVANNLFYIEGPSENATPSYLADYESNLVARVVWTNNVYQRGGVFPIDFPFENGGALYGNPVLAHPGGETAADYIPAAFVEGRGIVIEALPDDEIGIRIGLTVTNDYFGNPIEGLPDIGAVELGGGTSSDLAAAFWSVPASAGDSTVDMVAVPTETEVEYYFAETSGQYGADDSGWQSDPNYSDAGLLPNTEYAYAVSVRSVEDAATSVLAQVSFDSEPPFPDHILLDEDFSEQPNPDNGEIPFALNTWIMDGDFSWRGESSDASVACSGTAMRLGWAADEVVLQYVCDQTWDLTRDYQFSGDWTIDSIFTNHLGFIVGLHEIDPDTGAVLQRIKEITVGELSLSTTNQTDSFSLWITSAELLATGVSETSRIGLFLQHDDDGVLNAEGSTKNDIYLVDNLYARFFGDDVDSDGDEIPDGVETANGLDPDDATDGAGDLDSDGVTNTDEYLLGTTLNGTDDSFRLAISSDAAPQVSIPSGMLTNRIYILEQKTELLDSWLSVDSAMGSGGYTFPYTSAEDSSFYRTRVEWE